MEPMIHSKKEVVVYIPYRSRGQQWGFFLQKRDNNAPVHPNVFSMFGGSMEKGESIEEALVRELKEELGYSPQEAKYFCRFETSRSVFHVYIEEVKNDFETSVTVMEGEYGKFLNFEQIDKSPLVSDIAEMVVRALGEFLSQ